MSTPDKTPLFRIENPTLPFNESEGDYFSQELAGQWFDLTLLGALANLSRVALLSERFEAPAQLAIGIVKSDELEAYSASNHPIAARMSHFKNEYILPRDGSVPITEVDIDRAVRAGDRERIAKVASSIVRSHAGGGLIFPRKRKRLR